MNLSDIDNIYLIIIFFGLGFAGMFFNFAQKRASKTITDTLYNYIVNRPWRTVSSVGSMLAALSALLVAGAEISSVTTMAGGFAAGFGIDKLVNRGSE